MNRLVIVCLFCAFSNLAHAYGENCLLYNIKIKNETGADCVLKKYYIIHGHLNADTKMPEVIFRDGSVDFQISAIKTGKIPLGSALLNYECGDSNEIAFFTTTMTDNINLSNYNDSNSAVIESHNLDGSFNFKRCNIFYGTTNDITWAIKRINVA